MSDLVARPCDCFPLSARGEPGNLEIFCPKCGKVFRAAIDAALQPSPQSITDSVDSPQEPLK